MHRGKSPGSYPKMNGHYLEQENNELVDQMTTKVSALKQMTIQIGDEVRDQNKLLDDMDTDFDSSRGLLGSTMRRLGFVSNSGGHRFLCYLVLFCLLVFMVIYWLVR